MIEALTVTIEPVDDLPVLLTSATRLGLAELVDQHFKPHGNWQGLSPGRVLTGWLAYILSEGESPAESGAGLGSGPAARVATDFGSGVAGARLHG